MRLRRIFSAGLLVLATAVIAVSSPVSDSSATGYLELDQAWFTALTANSSPNNSLVVNDIGVDKNGEIYLVGRLDGTLDLDPSSATVSVSGGSRAVIVKYTSSGDYLWNMVVGGTNSQWQSIEFEPSGERWWVTGSIYGIMNPTTTVFNFNPRGQAVNVSGFSTSSPHMVLVRYDMSGDVVSNGSTPIAFRVGNASGLAQGFGLAAGTAIHVAGNYWSSSASPTEFNPIGSASSVSSGARSAGGVDAFVAKYSFNGELQWLKSFGSASATGNEFGRQVGVDSSGNVYTSGWFTTATNYSLGGSAINFSTQRHYLAKFDSSGAHQWSFRFSGDDTGSYDRVEEMEVSAGGNIYVSGRQSGTFDFRGTSGTAQNVVAQTNAYSGYIASFNSAGEYAWHVVLGHKSHPTGTTQHLSQVWGLSIATDGSIYAAGHYRGTMDFDGGAAEYLLSPSTASCTRDRFIARYSSAGALLWAERPSNTCDATTSSDTNLGGVWSAEPVAIGTNVIVAYRPHQNPGLLLAAYGPDTTAPSAPGRPDLTAASDLGSSSIDNITSDSTPTMSVSAAESGGTVVVSAVKSGQTTRTCQIVLSSSSSGDCTLGALTDGEWSVSAVHEDGAGNISSASTALTITIDTVTPILMSTSPLRDSTGVDLGDNIILTYDETMAKGSGNVLVKSGGSTCPTTSQTITVSNAAITVSGSTVTVNPTSDFAASTVTCLAFAAGVFRDVAGNSAALHDPTAPGGVRFTTAAGDTTPPTVTISAPSSPASSRSLVYALSFSEQVSGIAPADFINVGSATCTFAVNPTSGSSTSVIVTCTTDGTVILRMLANSVVDGSSNTGPTTAVTAATVTVDTVGPTTSTVAAVTTVAPATTVAAPNTTVSPAGTTNPPPTLPVVDAGPAAVATSTTMLATASPNPATAIATTTTTTSTIPAAPVSTLPPLDVPPVSDGGGALTIGGRRVEATVTRENNQLILEAGPIVARISALKREGGRAPLDADGRIRMMAGDSVEVEVTGFGPSTEVEVRLYSEPTLLGRSGVNDEGQLLASYEIPEGVSDGDHTVVLAGESREAEELVFALSVAIGEQNEGPSLFTIFVLIPLGLAAAGALIIPAVLRRRRREQPA